jgi:hypothetical protein
MSLLRSASASTLVVAVATLAGSAWAPSAPAALSGPSGLSTPATAVGTAAEAAHRPGRHHAEGGFEVVGYTSVPYRELPGGVTLSRLTVTDVFHGDIVGDGTAMADLLTRADGSSRDVGMIHVAGTLGGREGEFVIETAGSFDGRRVHSTWEIVPGSGSGDLLGLRGHGVETAELVDGEFVARYRLTYYFE